MAILLILLEVNNSVAFSQETSNIVLPDYQAIMYLVDNNIISSCDDGILNPNEPLTNGEFSVMVCKAFFKEDFKDGFSQEKCLNYINNQGFMKERTYNTDSIYSPIQLFAVANILGSIKQWTLPYSSNCYDISYTDWNNIDTKYQDKLFASISAGYITPSSTENIYPNGPITRADFCKMLYQILVVNSDPIFPIPQVLQDIDLIYLDNNTQLYSSPAVYQLKSLPESVLESFIKDNWKLVLVKGNMDKVAGSSYSYAIGLTIYNDHTIGMCSRYINLQGYNPINHEFGHYLDFKTGISNTLAMDNCVNKETYILKNITGRDYCAKSNKEFFAEAFMEYCYMDSVEFDTKMPLTKALIETALAQLLD